MWPDRSTAPLIAMGCMRLSTERDRDDDRAIATLHAAFDAGVTLLDTADAYCWDAAETGHNERLIARALASYGDRAQTQIRVATKGGLTRPQGAWVADGRAKQLIAACEASRRALGVERIDLYQLHAPDPRTLLATSVRALAALERDGEIDAIGLCNVNVSQIEEAVQIARIASVQVELSAWHDTALRNGVVEYCATHGIRVFAHRPFGGVTRARRVRADRVLNTIAARYGTTPFDIALAWIADLSEHIVPIPGATRIDSVRTIADFRRIQLTDEDRALLDERMPAARIFRRRLGGAPPVVSQTEPREGEVVLIMGLPGAGKSTLAATYVARGYERLNRDETSGSLRALSAELERRLAAGTSHIVLDNTYVSRAARADVVAAAAAHGLHVRCVWLQTSVEDAQVNAVNRILSRYGRLLTPAEMKQARRRDIAAFAPMVQFRYQRELEPPDIAEGFAAIDLRPFERTAERSHQNRALVIWCDGVLIRSRAGHRVPMSPEDVELIPERARTLHRYHADGWHLVGLSWQPEIAEEKLTDADAAAIFDTMRALLDLPIAVAYCPHSAGPPICWCRKPLPGLGLAMIQRYQLDPSQSIYVGTGGQDPGFARRLGFEYRDAEEFFREA